MKQKQPKLSIDNQVLRQKIDRDIIKRIDTLINKKMQKAYVNINKFAHSIMQNLQHSIAKNTTQNLSTRESSSKGFNFSSQQLMQNFALEVKKILIKNI